MSGSAERACPGYSATAEPMQYDSWIEELQKKMMKLIEDSAKAESADEVFEALEAKSANAGLSWIMTVLDILLSSNNDIVDQESSVLDFSPKFKQAVKDTERLDFLIEVGSAEFSKENGQKACCRLTEYGIRGYGSNYREALDDVMKEWKEM